MDRRAFIQGAAAIGLGIPVRSQAFGQSFPARTIRIVVPAPVGSPPDILVRIVGNAIAEAEGWTMVMESKPGGAMTIGVSEVLRQPADGYTLLSVTAPIAAASALVPSARLNIETDFAPVVQIGTAYNVLVVHPSTPVRSLAEFIAYLTKPWQAHLLVRRLRDAGTSAWRAIQTRDGRADGPCSLPRQCTRRH
jgi:tripartite-type tricarboxylate transporter receptor subunit TctC